MLLMMIIGIMSRVIEFNPQNGTIFVDKMSKDMQ